MAIDVQRLGATQLPDTTGRLVTLRALWAEQPAVLVWLRHYGCLLCREQTAEMLARADDFSSAGADLVFIGQGTVAQASNFQNEYAHGLRVLTDPRLTTYRLIGARSGLNTLIAPKAVAAYARGAAKGHRQGAIQGHGAQQGAVLALLPGDVIAYQYLSGYAGDHPSADAILASLRSEHATAG